MLTRPWWCLSRGRWAEARAAADRLDGSWLRFFPSARAAAAYVRALALHLEGRLDEALDALARVRSEKPVRSAVLVLEGATLVLAERDLERAAEVLGDACKLQALPEDLLLLAHARLAQGRRDDADRLFAAAGEVRPRQAGWRSINDAVFHFLRGLYLVRIGEPARASGDLEAAAASPITSVYVERARALLARREDSEPERSSLAPQVMDEGET